MLDFLKPKALPIEKSARSVADLTAAVAADRAAIDQARKAFRTAALTALEARGVAEAAGDDTPKVDRKALVAEAEKAEAAREAAARTLAGAERKLAATEAALSAAVERHTLAEDTAAAKARAVRWREVERSAAERDTLAHDIERQCAELAATWGKFADATVAMVASYPPGGVPHEDLRGTAALQRLRMELVRAGIDIAAPFWGKHSLRPFAESVRYANETTLQRRRAVPADPAEAA